MKSVYGYNFVYGKNRAKVLVGVGVALGIGTIISGNISSILQTVLALCTLGAFCYALYVVYNYCRCPNCGKRVIVGVLALSVCPKCKRSLTTGQKIKKTK